jgi:hypothetical protein
VPAVGSRQRLTSVSFGTAADGPLPRAPFAECLTLGKLVFAECRSVASVQHSVKGIFAEILTLPSAALGKAFFAECPTKSTRQRIQHSAKTRIPVVINYKDVSIVVLQRNIYINDEQNKFPLSSTKDLVLELYHLKLEQEGTVMMQERIEISYMCTYNL